MGPSVSPPATRSPSSRMRARGRATSSRSPRSSGPASSTGSACGSRPSRSSGGSRRSCEPGDERGAGVSGVLSALLIALAACATTTMSVSPTDRWRADLDAYRTRRGALATEVRQVTVDFQTLGAESSFPGLEDKIATLAARVRRGEEPDDEQTLTRSLWSLSLGELVLFQRYLALSSRPLSSTCAERAGKNVLNTPMGRLLKPGGMVRTKGSMQSYHVRQSRSVAETIVSTAVDRGSPARPNSAATTGRFVSANAGKRNVSIVRWSHRATAGLSL